MDLLKVAEITAVILGLIQGVLALMNKRVNWLFYILQMCVLLYFSFRSGLYGDALNDATYVVWGIAGLYLWGGKSRMITKASGKERIVYTLLIVLSSFGCFLYLKSIGDTLPHWDAVTSVISFVATYYMAVRKTDTWILWLVDDILYVIEYLLLPTAAIWLALLNVVWAIMAVLSYYNWKRIMREEQATNR